MDRALAVGVRVQTALGKGTVREIRNGGRVLVDVQGRALVFDARGVTPLADEKPPRRARPATPPDAPPPVAIPPEPARVREIDLHGLTVAEALARIDATVDTCMRDDVAQLRVIHGRSGGKLRAAVHRRLRGIGSVRAVQIDERNAGVTIVWF